MQWLGKQLDLLASGLIAWIIVTLMAMVAILCGLYIVPVSMFTADMRNLSFKQRVDRAVESIFNLD
jgi:hypothetical protein